MARQLPKPQPTAEQRVEGAAIVDGDDLPEELGYWPAPGNPMAVARELLKERIKDGVWTLRHWRGEWCEWRDTHYPVIEQAEVAAWIYKTLDQVKYLQAATARKPAEPVAWRPNRSKVADVLDALAKTVLLPTVTEAPTWLDDVPGRPSADTLIAVKNGLLEVGETGRRTLHPHNPAFFTRHAVPFAYAAKAPEPVAWLAFLAQLWPDDPEAISTLQQWMGYVLSSDTSQQKILLLVGARRSGKGTIARVLTALVGRDNHASPTLASLGTNFGLSPLIGKPLAVVSDARLSGKADISAITERLLSISGEDALTVDIKFKQPWTGQLGTRFMILSNELPRLGDASAAIASRFIILKLAQSFLGREDPGLTAKLLKELPSILNWALDGLDVLNEKGYFVQPASSDDAMAALYALVSPMQAFLEERCTVGVGEVSAEQLYGAWQVWAGRNGHLVTSTGTFGRDLRAAEPAVTRAQRGTGTGKRWVYTGLSLLPQAAPTVVQQAPVGPGHLVPTATNGPLYPPQAGYAGGSNGYYPQPQAPAGTGQAPVGTGQAPDRHQFPPGYQPMWDGHEWRPVPAPNPVPTSANGHPANVVPMPDRREGAS